MTQLPEVAYYRRPIVVRHLQDYPKVLEGGYGDEGDLVGTELSFWPLPCLLLIQLAALLLLYLAAKVF